MTGSRIRVSRRLFRNVDDRQARAVLDLRRLAGVGNHIVAGIAVDHEAVVFLLAIGPKSHGLREIEPVHPSRTPRTEGQKDRQEIGIVALAATADLFPELVFGAPLLLPAYPKKPGLSYSSFPSCVEFVVIGRT